MLVQTLVVALLVAGCAVYAAWTLMPRAGRRGIAAALLKLPLPRPVAAILRRHATAANGSGCSGCERNAAAPPPAGRPPEQGAPLVFHPRRKG